MKEEKYGGRRAKNKSKLSEKLMKMRRKHTGIRGRKHRETTRGREKHRF